MDSIPRQLLLQLFLILLNAFFAMTEIAVISLSPAKLRHMADNGDKTAVKLLKLVNEPSGFLSTIQIGITLAGFLASAFAADNFSDLLVNWVYYDLGFSNIPLKVLDTLSVIFITIVLSYFTLVLGELTPKRIAMQKPFEVAKISCGVVSTLAVVMRPVIWFLSASTNGLLRILGMKVEAEEETVTEEEIRMMVDLGEAKGAIESEEKEWIENVFDFGDALAHDVMTHTSDIQAISINATDEEIIKLIEQTGLSRYPVYNEDIDDIIGILNARDFLINRNKKKSLKDLLRTAYFVPDNLKATSLLRDMQSKKIHISIVVDEYGATTGLVTMEDLLEEIVGKIYDEFDPFEPEEIQQIEDGVWNMSGMTDIEDVAKTVGVELPEDADFDTLGGLIFSKINTIPPDGSTLDIDAYGLSIHVQRIEDRRIISAIVKKNDVNLCDAM